MKQAFSIGSVLGKLGEHKIENPSLLRPVHHCESTIRKRVTPACYPILTTAIVCAMCGYVYEYWDDDGMIVSFQQENPGQERPSKPWVVSNRTAHQVEQAPKRDRSKESKVLWMLADGKQPVDIARILGTTHRSILLQIGKLKRRYGVANIVQIVTKAVLAGDAEISEKLLETWLANGEVD